MTLLYSRVNRLLGPVLGLVALVLYVVTLSPGPYPGDSAAQMARQLGLDPFGAGSHLLWSLVVKGVSALPLGGLVLRLNLLSALCGAAAVWMMYRAVADTIWLAAEVNDTNQKAVSMAALLGGLAGAIALMGAMPFWYVSNRFHVASFDLLLLLLITRAFLMFTREALVWKGLLFAFLFGAGAVEFATIVAIGPLALIGVLCVLLYDGDLRWSRVIGIGAALLLGLLLYLPAAWQFMLTDEYRYGVGGDFWQALYCILAAQYGLIAHGLPQLGWLLVILVGIIPWLATLLVGKRGLNEEKDWGLFVLHAMLTGLAIALLFNASFAPWRLLGVARLLVTPYLLMAFCFGYLAAYWYLFPRLWGQNAEPEERGRIWLRERGGWIPALALIAVAIAAGVRNFPKADARGSAAVDGFARSIVSGMSGRQWLATDGTFDSNLLLAARDMKIPLRLLNMRMSNNAVYMRYVAAAFSDSRLKSLAEVDVLAFLREWMASDAHFADKVALQTLPDMWLSVGLQPVPDRAVFYGIRALADLKADSLWRRHEEFWREPFLRDLIRLRASDPLLAPYATLALRQTGMVANNLGVILEDMGRTNDAYRAYAQARAFDPRNVSALLNQMTMINQGYAAPDPDAVKEEFRKLGAAMKQGIQIWSLSRYCGYVRAPEAYANLGMVWALSGEPGMAVAGFKRAIELAPDRKDQLTQGLAMAYLAQDQSEMGEKLYREMLDRNPTNAPALLALSRAVARQSRFDEASDLLERARKAGVPRERIAIEYAALHLAAGEPGKARVVLQELVELQPNLGSAWAMLAGVLLQMGDAKALEDCERKLERIKGKDFLTMVVLGQIALNKADFVGARTYLESALAMRPNTAVLVELLLRLDVAEGRKDAAAQHVRSLLLLDSGNPFANQVLASLQMERKEYALAENSLRKSLERKRSPEALNDLAWVLKERGSLAEAEALVREALRMDDTQFNYWDTLGVILTRQGRLGEAEAALQKSLGIFAGHVEVQFHMAQLYMQKGERAKALTLAEDLLGRASDLSQEDRESLRKMLRTKEANP